MNDYKPHYDHWCNEILFSDTMNKDDIFKYAFECGYKQALEDNSMNVKHPPIDYPIPVIRHHCFGKSPILPNKIIEESLNPVKDKLNG